MSYHFKDAVIWITGASSGIGEQLAYPFSELGARLILSGRNIERLETVYEGLRGNGEAHILPFDIGKSEVHEEKYREALNRFGQIDVLVNNAGISQRASVEETDPSTLRKILEVNFFGNVNLTNIVLPHFKERGSGKVVVISSVAGKLGPPFRSAYAASKHALHGWYDAFRAENEHHGIQTHMICPGYIKTQISVNALTGTGKKHGVMDSGQAKGMSASECANRIISAIRRNKREVVIGKEKILYFATKLLARPLLSILKQKGQGTIILIGCIASSSISF